MRFLSLFSGIGGFDLAFERAGMECVGQVEIDPYCNEVLERHWPQVWRCRDVRDVGVSAAGRANDSGQLWESRQRCDLICGGFPCQPFSVAGRRGGEADERNLWPEFRRVVSELRPRWVVAENVPGLLSIDNGRFFGSILDDLGECGFEGVAYAVLDSRHFGVPQRRRRVFIVAGPTRRGVEQVLSLCESCGGHPPQGGAAGQDVAGAAGDGVAKPLGSHAGWSGYRQDLDNETYIAIQTAHTKSNGLGVNDEGVAFTLSGSQQAVAAPLTRGSASGDGVNEPGRRREDDENLVAYALGSHAGSNGERSNESHNAGGPVGMGINKEITPALRAGRTQAIAGAAVRRLTPTECARLQGFPDDWLHGSDAAKYRALGNAVTVPVVEWIGRRIVALETL